MRRLLALLVASLLLTTAACGGDSSSTSGEKSGGQAGDAAITGLTVTGDFGSAAKVAVDPAVAVEDATSDVLSTGSGAPVKQGSKTLLNLLVAIGKSGKTAVSTYDEGKPLSATMDDQQFFPPIVKALTGVPTGSRVAVADTVKDLYGADGASQLGLKVDDTLVFVIDVMSVAPTDVLTKPEGTAVDPPAGAPKLVEKGDAITRLSFDGASKPTGKLQVIPLLKGTGAAIDGPSIVTMDYLGQVFGRSKPFNNTYTAEPTSFDVGIGQLIPGWDKALQGQKVGSRVMLLIPPAQGYGKNGNPDIKVTGKSTLVFVIDILGVG